MLLRVQSPEGTRRIEITACCTTADLFSKIGEVFAFKIFRLYCKRDKSQEILPNEKTILTHGLSHGDMIFLLPVSSDLTCSVTESVKNDPTYNIDEVDKILHECTGRIVRKLDPKTCLHGDNSSCVNCLPIEPYDPALLAEHNIKHLSFHAYMRKLSGGFDKGKYANLEDVTCRLKSGCVRHPPWPKGICSACQPKAMTLNRQPYRHVDHIVFENASIVERFLNFWRTTGNQRIGFLYGRYDRHLNVPLGIKAVVTAIYEPPQESTRHSVKLLTDAHQNVADEIANRLGLSCVGWIFTDLLSEDISKGSVHHLRNADSHFLTAQECIMAGHFQHLHPNRCQMASSGIFGSKFVTVCVTGDSQNQIHMEGYQVSSQCQALVRDHLMVPTKDAPELAYIRRSSPESYIPDVYYKEKDSYGNEIMRIARPFPVEYLLLDVPISTPLDPTFMFWSGNEQSFPVENRSFDGHLQDISSLNSYLEQFNANRFIDAASDFHFLLYIANMDQFPQMKNMNSLLEAIKTRDVALAEKWTTSEQWRNVAQAMQDAAAFSQWSCQYCTFINPVQLTSCQICALPNQA